MKIKLKILEYIKIGLNWCVKYIVKLDIGLKKEFSIGCTLKPWSIKECISLNPE